MPDDPRFDDAPLTALLAAQRMAWALANPGDETDDDPAGGYLALDGAVTHYAEQRLAWSVVDAESERNTKKGKRKAQGEQAHRPRRACEEAIKPLTHHHVPRV
jgi:hypothetical protein